MEEREHKLKLVVSTCFNMFRVFGEQFQHVLYRNIRHYSTLFGILVIRHESELTTIFDTELTTKYHRYRQMPWSRGVLGSYDLLSCALFHTQNVGKCWEMFGIRIRLIRTSNKMA